MVFSSRPGSNHTQARTTEGAKAWLEVLSQLVAAAPEKKKAPPAVGPPPWDWHHRRSALVSREVADRAISGDVAPGSDS